jgi:hypothetical protein
MPKHGKVDETGAPHVGGNTWAGGTGGRDTAGRGGKGGPYRLSDGNAIHQISDEEKENVSPEAKVRHGWVCNACRWVGVTGCSWGKVGGVRDLG